MVHTVFMYIWMNLEQPIDAWTKIHIRNKNNLICTMSNCVWLGRQGGMVHANYTAPTLSFPKTTECIKNISILSDICRIVASIHLYRPSFTLPSLFMMCWLSISRSTFFVSVTKTWKDETRITTNDDDDDSLFDDSRKAYLIKLVC